MSDEHLSNEPPQRGPDSRRGGRPFFRRIFRSLARPSATGSRDITEIIALCQSLISERGEVSGIRIATEVLSRYRALDDPTRHRFFSLLAENFWPDYDRLARAADEFSKTRTQANMV